MTGWRLLREVAATPEVFPSGRRGFGAGLERISEGGSKPPACVYFHLWLEINIYARKTLRNVELLRDHLAAINELQDEKTRHAGALWKTEVGVGCDYEPTSRIPKESGSAP